MTGIQCNQGHVFSMIIDSESEKAIWKLEECYYMSQGCEVIKEEDFKFSGDTGDCPHCSILEHDFEELMEEITNERV